MVGVYQLLVMDTVADHAAVHESVEALKRVRLRATGYANAVLRAVLRNRDAIREMLKTQPLGVRESHPDRLVERWRQRFGETRTAQLCRWNNSRPEVAVRAFRLRTDPGRFRDRLVRHGLDPAPHPFAPDEFLVLPHGTRVTRVPGYEEGLFTVQDPSTALAVRLLDARPGECVLDACAAPGGKTVLLAEAMQGRGRLVAVDLHEDRLAVLRRNLQRLGLRSVEPIRADAAQANARDLGADAFDRVLLDVPCTNTGVLRRRPDARWRFSEQRLQRLRRQQQALLDNARRLLRPGARLVYSTCSLEPEEGEQIIRSWLAADPDFELLEARESFPPDTESDGVYAAALRRR
jgi:16S rRNA (cytosine967-C5)-methyltransferase